MWHGMAWHEEENKELDECFVFTLQYVILTVNYIQIINYNAAIIIIAIINRKSNR